MRLNLKLLAAQYPQLFEGQAVAQPAPPVTPQYMIPQISNPISNINHYYTRQDQSSALDPLQMYQNYKATGVIPPQTSSFTPFTPQSPTYTPAPTQTQAAPATTGGK